jgi:hypothetical protein
MNCEEFELKKPGDNKTYYLKIINNQFYTLKKGRWVIKKFSRVGRGYYQTSFRFRKNKQTNISLHRLVYYAFNRDWDIFDSGDDNTIDHIAHSKNTPLNNDIHNLRVLTKAQQAFNKESRGYCWNKKINKWQSEIMYNGIRKRLGYFENEEDARQAYLNAKSIHHRIEN